jgi:tetratricopeptide (TPR) repeat protein
MVVTIEVLPQEGWRVDDWAGPVFDVAGNVAKITMESSHTVVARMKRTAPMAASTANSTLRPLATKVPKPLARPTPVPTSVPLLPLPKGSASSYFEKGEGYSLDGKYRLAIVEFSTAIRLNPGYTSAYWARGWTHDYLNQYQQAIQDFDKAIQLDPYDVLPYISRGFSYYRSNSYHQAIKDFDKAIQLDPYDSLLHAMAYDGRSMAYSILGQDAKADADEAKACSLDSLYC